MKETANEFKQFVLRGNVVDLAVGVVIGGAFGAVVTSLVDNLITPLIAAIGGQPDFSEIGFTINGSQFNVGMFINAVISFLIIAAVIFFFVVKPMNMLVQRSQTGEPEDPTERKCPFCFSDVPVEATRCPYCTSELPPASAQDQAEAAAAVS